MAEVIGVRRDGLEAATILPLGLTMILFLGPIAMLVSTERFRWLIHPAYWTQCLKDWIWWRNHVVAPFTEEFAFRYVLFVCITLEFTLGDVHKLRQTLRWGLIWKYSEK